MIDNQKKDQIIEKVIKSRSELRLWSACAKLSIPVAVLFVLLSTGVKVIRNGMNSIDLLFTGLNIVFYIVFGMIFQYCFRLLLTNRASKDLIERVDEELTVIDDTILYAFRIRYHMPEPSRIVINIPIRSLNRVVYDAKTEMLEFHGTILSTSTDQYKGLSFISNNSHVLNDLIIYDYFSPGLQEILRAYGL